ncbi:TrkH family potassium uptake protein [Mariniblastus sp.]|nr:TrkH family potassium uptake protein [Mariniblastus sp.]
MNLRLLSKLLGVLSLLIGVFMLFSLIWSDPDVGFHTDAAVNHSRVEFEGMRGLLYSALISGLVGGVMIWLGRSASSKLFRKEAMAVVGLSWVLATVLGALPYMLSGVSRGPSVRILEASQRAVVTAPRYKLWASWEPVEDLSEEQFKVLSTVANASARGVSRLQITRTTGIKNVREVFQSLGEQHPELNDWLVAPGDNPSAPADRASRYRLRWVPMGLIDSMFEAQSGFSTTGATVLCDLEDPYLVPHCILFWRASTHFLGGLGIIVLFVVLLGQGSAGKALMRTEMPGPTQDSSTARMQHSAWLFAGVYTGLNVVLAIILKALGMSLFDAICHSFATMATGGFSTYNASLGHFTQAGLNGEAIEYVVIVFMFLAGANFTLLLMVLLGEPLKLLRDIEFRTYASIIAIAAIIVMVTGWFTEGSDFSSIENTFRNGLFTVVSLITTTGYGTADFDQWNHLSRAILITLMFVGGCAGSTGGGMKVIRHILFVKILSLEIESSFNPKTVRVLKFGGKPAEDQTLRHSILVYFSLMIFLFTASFLLVTIIEPDLTWGDNLPHKLIDSASAVAATLNNIGPGLGIVGATQNYANFCFFTKALFVWLMMLGRLEILPILVLLLPRFWRDQ